MLWTEEFSIYRSTIYQCGNYVPIQIIKLAYKVAETGFLSASFETSMKYAISTLQKRLVLFSDVSMWSDV